MPNAFEIGLEFFEEKEVKKNVTQGASVSLGNLSPHGTF